MADTESNISKCIKSKPKGVLLFPDDFNNFGTPAAIRKALQRLRGKGLIKQELMVFMFVQKKAN